VSGKSGDGDLFGEEDQGDAVVIPEIAKREARNQ
jgi:hypothetical protein